jgi:predicted nucleotide-binding protein (sugar kinase/HSP70/actin superfamily)
MKKRTATKETPVDLLGGKPDDARWVRRCLKELGQSQAWLAKEAGLSLIMVNSFLNGKKNLSPSASSRVMRAITDAQHELPRLSPEAAARIRTKANKSLTEASDSSKKYSSNLELLAVLAGPPRDPAAYRAWEAKQIEIHAAAEELPVAKGWIKEIERRNSDLNKQVETLEQIRANGEELVGLYRGVISRLKQQLQDAGITPAE